MGMPSCRVRGREMRRSAFAQPCRAQHWANVLDRYTMDGNGMVESACDAERRA